MAFSNKMTSLLFLVLLVIISLIDYTAGETYECGIENYGPENHQYCVFRNVNYSKNTTSITFKAPTIKQQRVVFENSDMEYLPKEFLEKFGNDLKVLNVSGCKLRSVVITRALEELYAIDNFIEQVIVHQNAQSSPMKEIYLQSNRLKDISNITKSCKNIRILDLSRNQELAPESKFDLSMFEGFMQLEYLLLADIGAFYLDYSKKVNIPSLTLLDLSMNNLLSSDLRLDYLSSLEKLEMLRLNDNNMAQLDYTLLVEMKSLKQVFLEGNSFDCNYQRIMIKFLNENNIQTPVARPARNCPAGFKIESQMCCKSEMMMPGKPITGRPLLPIDTNAPAVPQIPLLNEATTKRMDTTAMTGTTKPKSDSSSDNGVTGLRLNAVSTLACFAMILMLRY
ncbi:uncharacterized protein LOC131692213 isoform X2 [Topomyia yanbarensis]|uniref:uncharacterized protein LOC131692213 isoform X2 n=1 Tax=Topomyia yanbarensis TaxID=2498891 RepID=UPI00273BA806|nr:uncharacterized protein LOC131692213 isoform X2 [Topomyia yanbarensis]